MSLSTTCLQQHVKENAIAKKWLLRGLLIAAGAHVGLIPLMAMIPPDMAQQPERISLVVTSPTEPTEPIEQAVETPLTEESIEALTDTIAQAELAASAQVSGGISTPPSIASFRSSPPEAEPISEPISESITDSFDSPKPAADEPETDALSSSEAAEESGTETENSEATDLENAVDTEPVDTEPVDTEALETETNDTGQSSNTSEQNAETDTPDIDALRSRLARARARRAQTARDGTEVDSTEVARRNGPSAGSGNGTAEGEGDGDSRGANTVSCRQCDRPEYPEAALQEGIEGSPLVSLQYDENGNVVDAVLEQTSGNAALDQAALEAAQNYELDTGGQSGSISVEIDFGIEGSERSRAAQRRGERDSVSTPAPAPEPEREVVQDLTPAPSLSEPAADVIPLSEDNPAPNPAAPPSTDSEEPLEPEPEDNVPPPTGDPDLPDGAPPSSETPSPEPASSSTEPAVEPPSEPAAPTETAPQPPPPEPASPPPTQEPVAPTETAPSPPPEPVEASE